MRPGALASETSPEAKECVGVSLVSELLDTGEDGRIAPLPAETSAINWQGKHVGPTDLIVRIALEEDPKASDRRQPKDNSASPEREEQPAVIDFKLPERIGVNLDPEGNRAEEPEATVVGRERPAPSGVKLDVDPHLGRQRLRARRALPSLLETQRFDGVERRGLPCRVVTEADPDAGANR